MHRLHLRSCTRWSVLIATVVVAGAACGGSSDSDASAPGASPKNSSANSGDCPRYLTVAQVSEYMGRTMQSTLRAGNQLGVVCEWRAADDSSISASFRTYEGDAKTEFTDETGGAPKVSGYGDEAFQRSNPLLGPGTLFVRSGSLLFDVDVGDTNRRSGIDLQAVREKMARAVLAAK